jgi:microcystin-dependent protein
MKSELRQIHKPSGLATISFAVLALILVVSVLLTDKAPSYAQGPNAPIGTVVAFAGEVRDTGGVVEVAPGWLLCNGAALSSGQFLPLFRAIGAAHGNGSDDTSAATDFNLPDLRGLFLRGVSGQRTDRDPNRGDTERLPNHPGGNSGNRVGSVQGDAVGSHNHEINDPGHTHTFTIFDNGHSGNGNPGQDFPRNGRQSGTDRNTTGITIRNSGGAETRSKNAYVNYIIRAQ